MKDIICQECKKKIGQIDEKALVCSADQYIGIDIYCEKCKKEHIGKYYSDENQLLWEDYYDY